MVRAQFRAAAIMGFRSRRSRLLPFALLNIGRRGASVLIGGPALHVICTTLALAGCGVTSPIERADTTQPHFDGAVYKGTKTVIKPATPSLEAYRVFIQGATGFVSMSAVRDDAEQRCADFCRGDRD